jgi:hypothetical protein
MRAAQFLAIIGRGSKGSNALENTEDRAGATSEQQDNVINTVNSLDPYGPSWQLVPGNVAAGTVYAQVPTTGTGDLTFTRASTKTRTNAAGTVVDVASGVAAIDYRNADGSLSSTGRLLLEPQRTNSIRNSTMVGAVAGSPGTLPTNWTINTAVTQTIVGSGTENGLAYIDIRFNGTASGSLILLSSESSSGIAASNGQTWTNSFYFKTIASPLPPTSYNVHTIQRASGTNIGAFNLAFTPTTTLARYAQTVTTNQATITHIQPYFFASVTSGAAYDFTIRIAAPQMELGAYATTFIKTTTAAVTRVADSPSKTGVSSLIGQTEGVWYWEGFINDTGVEFQIINSARNTTNAISITRWTNNRVRARLWSNSVLNANLASAENVFVNTKSKIALSYKSGNIKLFYNGVLVASSTANFSFTSAISEFYLSDFVNFFGSSLNTNQTDEFAIFKNQLTDAQCIQMTTL